MRYSFMRVRVFVSRERDSAHAYWSVGLVVSRLGVFFSREYHGKWSFLLEKLSTIARTFVSVGVQAFCGGGTRCIGS